jgi:hypothetical protein
MVDPIVFVLLGIVGNVMQEIVARVLVAFGLRIRRGRSEELAPARVRKLVNDTASGLAELRRGELSGIPEAEWRAAAEAALDSLRQVAPLDVRLALEAVLDPRRLAEQVRAGSVAIREAAGLSESGQVAYERMVLACCEQIIQFARTLPEFTERVQEATLLQLDEVRRDVARLVESVEQERDEAARYERRYLDRVVDELGQFELFGVVRGRAPRQHSFDKYVNLAVARGTSGGGEDDEGLTGVGVDVANALVDHRRILVRAGAGAGKTTLLQWLAVNAARGTLPGEAARWGSLVPFFIPLRRFADGDLPQPHELPNPVADVLAGEMPPGWVNDRLASGRALLLVDGVDELTAEQRSRTKAWLRRLAGAYPQTRYVVTTRPAAVAEDWLAEHGFVAFDLLPMSATGVRQFLVRWHDAAREEYQADPPALAWLDGCERGLAEMLATRPELRRLAATPLLCGLICALYQDRNTHLPRDRRSLYEAALELLLVRWDEQRGIRVDHGPSLSQEEQTVVLQRFAYSLVKNQDVLLPRPEAVARIGHAMRGLRPQHDEPAQVLQHTLERTGLLREPFPDQVQFVHRTFRDFLAAKEVVDSGDISHLVEQAHLDHWHDVVIMAVAHARPRERERILGDLLRGNAEARRNPRVRDRLHLVAAACLEQADVMHTDEIRLQVQQAAGRLIPPSNLDDAELLAKAGPFVLDLLPGPDGLTEHEAACVVRAAAMIGGEGAWEKIAGFSTIPRARVIDELLRAWRHSDNPENYARTVLARVDFGDRALEVQRWSRVQYLRYLPGLTRVSCRGDLSPLDPLAATPNLRSLELLQNMVLRSLSPLTRCGTLRNLQLAGCPLIADYSPLADTAVETLGLHFMNADLGTLTGSKVRSLSIRDRAIDAGLEALPVDLPLLELVINNRPPRRNLRGVDRWPGLEHLAVFDLPDLAEVAEIEKLPRLQKLTVHEPTYPPALAALYRVEPLRELHVGDIPAPVREAVLATLRELDPRIEVYVDGEPLRV